MDQKKLDPIQNIFIDLKKIIDFIYVKDINEAAAYETVEYANDATMWMNASIENDSYLTYVHYWKNYMFQEVRPAAKMSLIKYWMEHPFNVPLDFREHLRVSGRKEFLNQYEEKNNYYRRLNGLPDYDDEDFIYLSEELASLYKVDIKTPVHQLSTFVQSKYMMTDEYKDVLENNPDKKYLKFMGIYKIDYKVSRSAKNFEIIRYPNDHYNINPNLLEKFKNLYNDYREYVMVVLYNPSLENIFPNYQNFMGLIIIFYTLMQLSNSCIESMNDFNYLDDTVIQNIFSLYNIPDDLSMTDTSRRKLVMSIVKLIQNKGTNQIYYDIIDILGYNNTKVNQLLLMQGNGDPYFLEVDLKDKNLYNTLLNNNCNRYEYSDIISKDSEWINDDEVQAIVKNNNYSASNSKFISLTSFIEQTNYLFESIFLLRFILDTKDISKSFLISIPELFGSNEFSFYDIAIALIAAKCKIMGLSGKIDSSHIPLATSGFNFDIDVDALVEFLNTTKYVDKSKVLLFIQNIYVRDIYDINRVYNGIIIPMRDWLKYKIINSDNKDEFNEYEKIYQAIFTYDIDKNYINSNFKMPIEKIQEKLNLTKDDINELKLFYPHTNKGIGATVDNIYDTKYSIPFISYSNQIPWYIHLTYQTSDEIEDRGYLYFYDILNSNNCMELTNSMNNRIFMDYENDEWVINKKAVNEAINMINYLSNNAMKNAAFQITTPNGSSSYVKGKKLSLSIRAESVFKNILINKIDMDSRGLSKKPTTYMEYIYQNNSILYDFLNNDLFNTNREEWINGIVKIVLALEKELDLYLKYFEESIIGKDLFFKPLAQLINRFKSTFVKLIKYSFIYLFNDKIDSGGNSNMVKFFDYLKFTVYFNILAKGEFSEFGLFDAEALSKYNLIIKDYLRKIKKRASNGSINFKDHMIIFLNNEELEPFEQSDEEITELINNRKIPVNINYDLWKNCVESLVIE